MTKKADRIRKWKHKETGKEFRVLPWWSCEGNLIDKPKEILDSEEDTWKERLYAIGVLAQIGWLIENDEGVWFGVGPSALSSFTEIDDDLEESK